MATKFVTFSGGVFKTAPQVTNAHNEFEISIQSVTWALRGGLHRNVRNSQNLYGTLEFWFTN